MTNEYDLIIVGGGTAGLSAALTGACYKLKTLVIDAASAGGAMMNNYPWKIVDNTPGFKDMKGCEVAEVMVNHVKDEGVEINENEGVVDIKRGDDGIITVETSKTKYTAKAVVISIGMLGTPFKLGVPGEDLKNAYFTLADPNAYSGKKTLVVGGGDTAVEWAVALDKGGADSHIIHRKDVFRANEKNQKDLDESNTNIHWFTEMKEVIGENGCVKSARLINNQTNTESIIEFDYIFFGIGSIASSDFLEKIGVETDEKKRKIKVDKNMRTSIEGIFAAGDVVGTWIKNPQAIGEGAYAGINAYKYIKNPYWA